MVILIRHSAFTWRPIHYLPWWLISILCLLRDIQAFLSVLLPPCHPLFLQDSGKAASLPLDDGVWSNWKAPQLAAGTVMAGPACAVDGIHPWNHDHQPVPSEYTEAFPCRRNHSSDGTPLLIVITMQTTLTTATLRSLDTQLSLMFIDTYHRLIGGSIDCLW
jgi:hypothetical protein